MVKKGFNLKKFDYFLLIFAFVAMLCYMTPYMGDDWAWGSELGIERLQNGFKDYNGRYFGNLLVIALTRSQILKTAVMSCVIMGTLALMWQTVKHKSFPVFLMATVGFCVMPRYIFRQTVAWVSGFTNYVVPTFLVLAYIFIIKSIFDGKPKFKKGSFVLTFLLGASTALFMENITLYQVAADVLILIGVLIAYRKVFAPIISHFVGSIVGCVIMFTNGAYLNIANSNDDYRTMETDSVGIIEQIKNNLFTVVRKELALNNVVLNILLTVLCIVLVFGYIKKAEKISVFKKLIIWSSLSVITSYTFYSIIRVIYPNWNIVANYTKYFESIYVVLFGIALIILSLTCVKETGIKLRLSFYIVSIAILTVPLLVVTPIRSRCFYCGYIFFVLFAAELFGYLFGKEHALIKNNALPTLLLTFCVFFGIYYTSIYGYIYKASLQREAYIQQQIDNDEAVIEIPELPYQGYLWDSTPNVNTMWGDRYKTYRGIDKDVQLKVIKYSEWKTK